MKTFTILLIYFIFLAPLHAFSQDIIKEGLVVFQNGNIKNGEIRARNWSRTPQRILFRNKGEESFTEYGAEEVQFFEAGGERYWQANVLIDPRPIDVHSDASEVMSRGSIPTERKTVFLKCLISGTKYDLLELIDITKSHFYLKDKTGLVTLLEYSVYINRNEQIRQLYGFRHTLSEINRKDQNEPTIEKFIGQAAYDARSLMMIIQAINLSGGKVLYKQPPEPQRKIVRFFAGPAAGITVCIPSKDWGLSTGRGSLLGFITGIDLSLGYSCNGGESFFRFDILFAKMMYAANTSAPVRRRLHESLQYNIVPSIQFRLPLFHIANFQSHIGGGFKTPIHLSEQQKISRWKTGSSDEEFPWVAITVGGQLDFELWNKWEIGVAAYQSPSVDFSDAYYEPIHYYTWIAYRL